MEDIEITGGRRKKKQELNNVTVKKGSKKRGSKRRGSKKGSKKRGSKKGSKKGSKGSKKGSKSSKKGSLLRTQKRDSKRNYMLQHGGVKDKKLDKLFGIVPTSPSSQSPTLSSNVTDKLRFLANLDLLPPPPPPPPPPQNNPKSQELQDQSSPPKPIGNPNNKDVSRSSQTSYRGVNPPSTLYLKKLPLPPPPVPSPLVPQAVPPPQAVSSQEAELSQEVPPPVPQAVSSQEAPPRPMNYPKTNSYRGNGAPSLQQSQMPKSSGKSRLPRLPTIPINPMS